MRVSSALLRVTGLTLGLSISSLAHAHFNLLAPASADTSTEGGKGAPPCGNGPNSGKVTAVQGGHPIELKVDEYVYHPGFYRVALSLTSRSELPVDNVVRDKDGMVLPPNGMPKGTAASAEFQEKPVFPVLADNLFPHTSGGAKTYTAMITLPNVTCEKCTLQVIEFMANHAYNTGGGYFYHHCADLKITADPALPVFDPKGMGGTGGAAAGGSAGATMGGSAGASAGGTAGASSSGGAAEGGSAGQATGGSSGGSAATTGGSAAGGGESDGGNAPTGTGATAANSSGGAPGSGATAGSATAGTASTGTGTSGGATAPSEGGAGDEGGCSLSTQSRGGSAAAALAALAALGWANRRRSRKG